MQINPAHDPFLIRSRVHRHILAVSIESFDHAVFEDFDLLLRIEGEEMQYDRKDLVYDEPNHGYVYVRDLIHYELPASAAVQQKVVSMLKELTGKDFGGYTVDTQNPYDTIGQSPTITPL